MHPFENILNILVLALGKPGMESPDMCLEMESPDMSACGDQWMTIVIVIIYTHSIRLLTKSYTYECVIHQNKCDYNILYILNRDDYDEKHSNIMNNEAKFQRITRYPAKLLKIRVKRLILYV